MSIPTVTNYDRERIPSEGSPTLRQDAEYLWHQTPGVIDSMNSAISGQNEMSIAITLSENNAKESADNAEAAKNVVNQDKTDIDTMKGEVLAAKEHIDGINEGIDGAITDAVNTQIGVYTDAIRRNSTKIKMQNFGLKLI